MPKHYVDWRGIEMYASYYVGAEKSLYSGEWTPVWFSDAGDDQYMDETFPTAEAAYERAKEYFT